MSNGKRYEVFNIIEKGEGQRSYWLKIGIAFTNKDGSLSVFLDALPMNGKLQIREPRERQEGGFSQSGPKGQQGDAYEGNDWTRG